MGKINKFKATTLETIMSGSFYVINNIEMFFIFILTHFKIKI